MCVAKFVPGWIPNVGSIADHDAHSCLSSSVLTRRGDAALFRGARICNGIEEARTYVPETCTRVAREACFCCHFCGEHKSGADRVVEAPTMFLHAKTTAAGDDPPSREKKHEWFCRSLQAAAIYAQAQDYWAASLQRVVWASNALVPLYRENIRCLPLVRCSSLGVSPFPFRCAHPTFDFSKV